MRGLMFIVVLAGFAISAAAQEGATDNDKDAATTSIQTDLAALADAQFQVRETAVRRLVARKFEAVAPLTELAAAGSTEASIRAFDILRQIYRDGDDATCAAVESSLEALADSENVAVAARADSSINGVSQLWHQRAVERFVKFGGIIHYLQPTSVDGTPKDQEKDKLAAPIQDALINDKWTGGDEGLKYLRRIDEFRVQSEIAGPTLFVVKGMISKDALADLQSTLPSLHIQERGPACLGISPASIGFRQPGEGLTVAKVKEGSAADLAGIRENDRLLNFDGHYVDDFETLVEKIGEKRPGDKVRVVFQRGGVEASVVVELRGWE